MPITITPHAEGATLAVRAQPGARKNAVLGEQDTSHAALCGRLGRPRAVEHHARGAVIDERDAGEITGGDLDAKRAAQAGGAGDVDRPAQELGEPLADALDFGEVINAGFADFGQPAKVTQ